VVASWVVLVPADAVGAAGVPVKVGLAIGAYVDAAVAEVRYGDRRDVNPAPLTVPLADSVVNDPVLPLIGLFVMPSANVKTPVLFETLKGLSTSVPDT
jgi:hypothetical protein